MKEYYIIDPQTYDDQFWWKKDAIEFWKKIFNNTNIPSRSEIAEKLVEYVQEEVNGYLKYNFFRSQQQSLG